MGNVFDPLDWSSTSATVSSLQRVGTRIGMALIRSIRVSPAAFGKEAMALLTVDNLWALAIVLAFWILGSIVGGPIGIAVNAILIAYALWDVPKIAEELGTALRDGLQTAATAKSDADLDLAAAQFASVFATVGVGALQIVVTHRVFVYAKPKLLKRFPKPPALENEHKASRAAVEKSESERKANTERQAESERQKAERERKAASEKQAKNAKERVADAAKAAAELTAAAGVKPAADSLPNLAAYGAAAVVVVATSAAVVYLASEAKK